MLGLYEKILRILFWVGIACGVSLAFTGGIIIYVGFKEKSDFEKLAGLVMIVLGIGVMVRS